MKSRRPILLVIATLAVAALAGAVLAAGEHFTNAAGGAPVSPEQQASALIDDLVSGSTAYPSSSNPYDYASNNPAFDALVALETPALKVAGERLSASAEDGLTEYLTAIAAERIARVDLRATSTSSPWETGKGWLARWNAHVRAIPEDVAAIAQSNAAPGEKVAELIALGTPALPYILDRVAQGSTELGPAVVSLAQGTAEGEAAGLTATVTPVWAGKHAAAFNDLRAIVEAQRQR